MIPKREQEYKVAARSSTTNAFGLRGHVLVDRWGESWEVGLNHTHSYEVGDTIMVPAAGGVPQWARFGAEIPRRLEGAPAHVVRTLWGNRAFPRPIIELRHNGDPYGSGFEATQSNDDGHSWFFRGDIPPQPRTWWRSYCRQHNYRLREATEQYNGSRKGAA